MTNKYAIIENGVVVNVVIADAEYAGQQGWVECLTAGPNWTYADGVFTEPVATEPVVQTSPTKEELLVQLQIIQAQIQALA